MNKKITISLSALILFLLCIIAAGVYELYHDVPREAFCGKAGDEVQAVVQAEVTAETQSAVKAEDTAAQTPVPEQVTISTEVLVTNCATGKKNTLRQNPDNSIELINEKGKSLWKRQMPAMWGGAAAQIDYYNNGKIQFLVAAGDKVYLIDRLGRDVKGFPMVIPSEAVQGPLSVEIAGAAAWEIKTVAGSVYLNAGATEILTQAP